MIIDVTKVTYNMYSCDTCCMSREMMKWTAEVLPNVENPKLWDIDVLLKNLNEEKDKKEE